MSESGVVEAARVEVVEEEAAVVGDSRNTTEVEQPDEAGASGSGVPRQEPGNQVGEREEAVGRIRKSNLPPALRERLAAVVEAGESPRLDVAACLEAIEETLPEFLRGERRNVARPSHPVGEAFFHGTEELTDAEAETLATKQLERSGLLRGQRVRGRE